MSTRVALVVVSLFAWHAAPRILCTLHGAGIHKGMVATLTCYGAPLAITAITSVSLLRTGF
jgi:fumarate reductase subunit D